jgi:hypothetical protein
MKDDTEESYILSEYKIEEENTHHSGGQKHQHQEEDEDEEGGTHQKSMNCAHQ